MCYTNSHSSCHPKPRNTRWKEAEPSSLSGPCKPKHRTDMAVRPSLIYQKNYTLRLQGFTGSHSWLLKHHYRHREGKKNPNKKTTNPTKTPAWYTNLDMLIFGATRQADFKQPFTVHGCPNTYLQFNNMSSFAHYYYSWPCNCFQLVRRPESRQTSLSSWSLNQTLGPAIASSSKRKLSLS